MKGKFEKILNYPIKIFNNKYVLRITIYSCLCMYLLLSAANLISSLNPELFKEYSYVYYIIKDSIYQVLVISSLGYFISKYKFCYWSLLSFYGIVYIKFSWFINKYIYEFPQYVLIIDLGIISVILTMVLYFLYKNYKIN